MKEWPEGLATLTVKWDDGSELVVTRVEVRPQDLSLTLDEPPGFDPFVERVRPVTRGWVALGSCEMTPDDKDTFYTFRMGE